MDLADLWRGGLSIRRVSVLVHHLPADSATAAVLTGLPREWSGTIPWLLEYIIQSLTGARFPSIPGLESSEDKRASRTEALLDHQRRMAEREAELAQNN